MPPSKGLSAAEIAALPYRPCVGVVLTDGQGRVFTGQRVDSPISSPAWQMPQGGMDPGETVEEAGLRELHEETGVRAARAELVAVTQDWVTYDLPPELVGKLWKGKYRGQKQKWLLLRFLGEDAEIDISGPPAEFKVWAWKEPQEVLDKIVPFKRAVYEAVFAEFGPRIASQ